MKADADAVDAVVLSYLKKKGYSQAEQAFRQEAKLTGAQPISLEELAWKLKLENDASIAHFIMLHNNEESARTKTDESYSKFKEWIHQSLDLYRGELMAVLFPVFVHCYLDLISRNFTDEARKFMEKHKNDHLAFHASDVNRLAAVTTTQQMQESDLVRTFRNNKFNVRICRYACELLLCFLQDNKFMHLLSIINQYVNLKVYNGQPDQREFEEYQAITGATEKDLQAMQRREVQWGLLDVFPPSLPTEEDDKSKAGAAKKKPEAAKKPPQAKMPSRGPESDTPRIKSKIPLPRITEQASEEYREDLRARVPLSATSLPSVCFYTFLNAHGGLNAVALARDGSLAAGAFADSSVKFWDFNPDRVRKDARRYPPTLKRVNGVEDHAPLIGHSGPVYGVCFSPDGNFLLSSSEDSTVRLWSMDTRTALVAYKGHNYPVWDVQFSPLGYYFATASHDRTARLWSTDHVFPLRIFAGHLSDVECVKFHPNCNYVATGSADKTVRLWEVHSGECVRIFTGHSGSIYALAFSPDGRLIASAGEDRSICLWDIGTGGRLRAFTGHTKCIWSVDFSAEGSLLASGSADETVRLWDVNRARGITPPDEHEDSVAAAIQMTTPSETSTSALLKRSRHSHEASEALLVLPTLRTPVYCVSFTNRNLLLASGPARPPPPSQPKQQ